jgi:SET domain-containing protein
MVAAYSPSGRSRRAASSSSTPASSSAGKRPERRYPVDPVPYHTFLFEIGDGSHCLDAQRRGSAAKWFNHSCKPNCEVEEDDDERVWVRARRDIKVGEEMTYDYNLTCPEKVSMKDKKLRYPCWCGAKNCRQTMLGKS